MKTTILNNRFAFLSLFFFAGIGLSILAAPSCADEVLVSHCLPQDSTAAINDKQEPVDSHHRPRHSFWPHQGTREWVEYHFDEPRALRSTSIYWLDDTPGGMCPVPLSWSLFYRDGDAESGRWLPVPHLSEFGIERHVFNRVEFDSITTTALRIEVQSREGYGSGIIEWDVRDDPAIDRAREIARLRARLDRLHFRPPESSLFDFVLSDLTSEGYAYLERLAAIETAGQETLLRLERSLESDPTHPPEFAEWESATESFREDIESVLKEEAEKIGPILYYARHTLSRPNAANCHIWQSRPERWGCSIRVFDPRTPDANPVVLFEDPQGSIYDAELTRDASAVLFTFQREDEPCWQIYRLKIDLEAAKASSEDRPTPVRLSQDPNVHDVAPIELQNGSIAFVSTRRDGFTLCQPGPTSNLHVMSSDGKDVRCVSQNTLSDFSPHLLPDGRILFTRWEYIDRDLTYRQSLWTQNPDGRRYQLFFGNTIRDVGMFWQSRPVPGRDNLLLSTFAPHHGWPHGAVGFISNRFGLEAPRGTGFDWITPEFPVIEDRSYRFSYRDPFPLSDALFLTSYGREKEGVNRFGLYLMDICGNRVLLQEDPEFQCLGPITLRPRETPLEPASDEQPETTNWRVPADPVDLDQTSWGTAFVSDVYNGADPLQRGDVAYIQIMEQVRKQADLRSRAYDQSPVMSYATYYAKRCWGRVPVEEDGSAHFQVPALREIYFQLLDVEGRELHRQTSAVQLMPGETQACSGCHEPRHTTPLPSTTLPTALQHEPDRPSFPEYAPDGIVDFRTVVQPVLDAYCVECHEGPSPDGGYDLSNDTTRFFNMAYDNLLGVSRSYRQHDMGQGQMLDAEAARAKPLVHFYWLLRTPTAIHRPMWSGSHASRLLDYVDTDHAGEELPREARERIYLWIDANVPYYGTYEHTRPNAAGLRDLYADPESDRPLPWFADEFLPTYFRRCESCHGAFPEPNDHGRIWEGHYSWINLSRPENSAAINAHLAISEGGRGLGVEPDGAAGPPLFESKQDADYQTMLEAIRKGKEAMLAFPRVDM